MPYTWQVLDTQGLGYGRLTGIVRGDEVLEVADVFCNDGAWQPGNPVLWDNTRITKLAITPKQAGQILKRAAAVAKYLGASRAAAVISPDLQMMGEHLIHMSGMNPERVRLFKSVEAAAEWLGVPLSCLPRATVSV